MTQTKEKTLVPELRFPDFEGEWVGKKMKDVLSIGSGRDYKHLNKGYYPVYGTGGLMTKVDSYLHDGESIGIGRKGTIDNPIFLTGKFWTVDTLFYTHTFIESKAKFLFYIFRRINWKKHNEASGVPSLSKRTIENIKIILPHLPEQQKIATFLTAIDQRVQAFEKKKSLLEQYKKGMMQKIFSQEIRFKREDGKAFPDWEKRKLGEVFTFLKTNSLSREKLNYKEGSTKNIHYGDIHTKFSSRFIINNEFVPWINENIDLSKIQHENYCKEGDIVIADASEDYLDIGKTIELVNLNGEKILAGLHTFLARPIFEDIKLGFSCHLFKSWQVRKQIMNIAQGTKVLGISKGRMLKIVLQIPSLPEQTRIANFLSALDKKIELVDEQIEKTRTYKKGLLQKMFV